MIQHESKGEKSSNVRNIQPLEKEAKGRLVKKAKIYACKEIRHGKEDGKEVSSLY